MCAHNCDIKRPSTEGHKGFKEGKSHLQVGEKQTASCSNAEGLSSASEQARCGGSPGSAGRRGVSHTWVSRYRRKVQWTLILENPHDC